MPVCVSGQTKRSGYFTDKTFSHVKRTGETVDQSKLFMLETAPLVETSSSYQEYLRDFDRFLDFLKSHPEVASAQTMKRPKVPGSSSIDKTLTAIRNKLPKNDHPIVDSSDEDNWTPVTSNAGGPKTPVALPSAVPADSQDVPRFSLDTFTKPKLEEQIGKKKALTQIKVFCSDGLAEALVVKNRVSRAPDDFAKLLSFLKAKHARKGRKLDQQDVVVRRFDVEPDPLPNQATYTDFEAMWNSAEDV